MRHRVARLGDYNRPWRAHDDVYPVLYCALWTGNGRDDFYACVYVSTSHRARCEPVTRDCDAHGSGRVQAAARVSA